MRPLLHRGAEPIAKRRLWGRQRMESTHLRSTAAAYMHSGVAMPDMIIPAEQCQTMKDVRIGVDRSEEHTSELQSLMRTSYAVFCLKKKTTTYSNFQPIPTPQS